jgi:hypothetical protein
MFSPVHYAGAQPFNDWFAPDTTQRHALGLEVAAVDPFWGGAFFVYFKSNATIVKGSSVVLDETFTGTLLPNTVTQGFSFGIAMAPMAAGTYGWLQISGRAVYAVTGTSVAADGVIAINAAGLLGPTATGKQVIGIRHRIPQTGTVTFANTTTVTGSSVLIVSGGYDGAFLGMALSGTGIPASTVAAKLNPDGRTILMGSAVGTVDKLATASGGITMTGTYTNYGSGIINRPTCMQIVA